MLSEMKTETITLEVAFEDGQVTLQMEELSLVREYYLTWWNFVRRPLCPIEGKGSPGKGLHVYV